MGMSPGTGIRKSLSRSFFFFLFCLESVLVIASDFAAVFTVFLYSIIWFMLCVFVVCLVDVCG